MLFMKHNFVSNYQNADGAEDNNLKRDILISEIAKLIVNKPQKVISLLSESGYDVSAGISSEDLSVAVVSTLSRSEKFATLITEEILRSDLSFSQDGTKPNLGESLGSIALIISGIGSIFGGKKRAEADKAKAEADKARARADSDKAKASAEKSMIEKVMTLKLIQGKGANIALYITGGLLLVAVAVGVWYFLVKK